MADNNTFKGFCLFNDVEDVALRTRNRAVVLTNIATMNAKNRKITPSAASLILGYFNQVPQEERLTVKNAFMTRMNEEGFHLVTG